MKTTLLVLVSMLPATAVLAQQTLPADRPPPINDPAPASPIDRPKSSKPVVEVVEPDEVSPPVPPRPPGTLWLGWTFGSGYGWYNSQNLETRSALKVGSSFGAGTIGHFGPEVGFQYTDRLALSLQLRSQVIPRKVSDPSRTSESKRWGHTALAKALYVFPREGFQPYLGAALGGGSGVRFRVDPQPSNNLPNSDTVRGGPVVVGPVAGLVLPLVERLSIVGEFRALVGAPDLAAMADFNVGLQFNL